MFSPESYTIIASIFPLLLGLIYFFAFGAFLFQIKGLIGENGILPVDRFLRSAKTYYPKRCYYLIPTVFWINCSNQALMAVTGLGTLLSVCLVFGLYPPLMLFLLYILYLSIVSAGQEFLGFGWEGFLLEITINAFLLSLTHVPNLMVWISINFLLFRFYFSAGLVKLQSRDPSWHNMTAIAHHYQSQPLPNTIAWYVHKLPLWFHKLTCVGVFFEQLIIPFGIFGTDEIRLWTFILLAFLQYVIWVSGNYSFLNHLSVVFCTILVSNSTFIRLFGMTSYPEAASPFILNSFLTILGSIFILFQVMQVLQHYLRSPLIHKILSPFSSFHLFNRYGIFAVMTTKRYEMVVEGSEDGETWKEYLFPYKPSEINRRPRRIAPYQPRLDWQAWFLPFSRFESNPWFHSFLYHLLKGTPDVLKLLRVNPFSAKPPKFVRTLVYLYEFSSYEQKKKEGVWWRRIYVEDYTPTLSLKMVDE